METSYQTSLGFSFNLNDGDQVKKTWAFARDMRHTSRRRKRKNFADYKHCVITACSPHAKSLGIRAGMKYQEAKQLIPQIRVIVIGDRNV